MRATVVYEIAGTVLTDVLVAEEIRVQRMGTSVLVSFPKGDGAYRASGTVTMVDDSVSLLGVDYAICHKVTRHLRDSDTCTRVS